MEIHRKNMETHGTHLKSMIIPWKPMVDSIGFFMGQHTSKAHHTDHGNGKSWYSTCEIYEISLFSVVILPKAKVDKGEAWPKPPNSMDFPIDFHVSLDHGFVMPYGR